MQQSSQNIEQMLNYLTFLIYFTDFFNWFYISKTKYLCLRMFELFLYLLGFLIEKNGGRVTMYINFLLVVNILKLVSLHTESIKHNDKHFWYVERKFIPCYKVSKLKLCITGVGVVIKEYLSLWTVKIA